MLKKNIVLGFKFLQQTFASARSQVQIRLAAGILATIFIALFISAMLTTYVSLKLLPYARNTTANIERSTPKLDAQAVFTQAENNVLKLNIFNITKEIPKENFNKVVVLDPSTQPCNNTESLPVELVGIIYTHNPATNLVTLKDTNVEMADVYREGQAIIDHEDYTLYKVTGPNSAEFMRNGTKICALLDSSIAGAQDTPHSTSSAPKSNEQVYPLSGDFVDEQLGSGFAKILTSAHIVPEKQNGQNIGFRITAIKQDSLFSKIGLENGDVITHVNGTSLSDASQGFKLYEAFQDEATVTLEIMRSGKTITKRVTIQ